MRLGCAVAITLGTTLEALLRMVGTDKGRGCGKNSYRGTYPNGVGYTDFLIKTLRTWISGNIRSPRPSPPNRATSLAAAVLYGVVVEV
jgi:hypothetical protein